MWGSHLVDFSDSDDPILLLNGPEPPQQAPGYWNRDTILPSGMLGT